MIDAFYYVYAASMISVILGGVLMISLWIFKIDTSWYFNHIQTPSAAIFLIGLFLKWYYNL